MRLPSVGLLQVLLLGTIGTLAGSEGKYVAPRGWREATAEERQLLRDSPRTSSVECELRIVDVSALQSENALTRISRVIRKEEPLLIRGLKFHKSTGARRQWRRSRVLKRLGTLSVDIGKSSEIVNARGIGPQSLKLRSYLEQNSTVHEEAAYAFTPVHEMMDGPAKESVSLLLAQLTGHVSSIDESYGGEVREYLLIGRPSSGVYFHSHGKGYNFLVAGEKRWYLFANGCEEPSRRRGLYEGMRWWLSADETTESSMPTDMWQCTQRPGDLIYLPEGWLHATWNLGETVAVATQQEFPQSKLGKLINAYGGQLSVPDSEMSVQMVSATMGAHGSVTRTEQGQSIADDLLALHTEMWPLPKCSPSCRAFRSTLHHHAAIALRRRSKLLASCQRAEQAVMLNRHNVEAFLLWVVNGAEITDWSSQLGRLEKALERDESYALAHIALGTHLLAGLKQDPLEHGELGVLRNHTRSVEHLLRGFELERSRAIKLPFDTTAAGNLPTIAGLLHQATQLLTLRLGFPPPQ